jgi:hypothetical protein
MDTNQRRRERYVDKRCEMNQAHTTAESITEESASWYFTQHGDWRD